MWQGFRKPDFRKLVALAAVILFAVAVLAPRADAQDVKQIPLNDKQVEGFIAAQKDLAAIAGKIQAAGDKPDAALQKELDDIAKKHGFTSFTELDDVAATLAAVARWVKVWPKDEIVLVDLHGVHPEPPPVPGSHDPAGTEGLAEIGASALAAAPLSASVHRVMLAAARSGEERGMSAVDLVTFARPTDAGGAPAGAVPAFAEDRSLRGLHPMMAERLHLWRFANFAVERLPSAEDVYLFRGVARENPKDERLFALAEVRDLSPATDAHGRLVSLPQM